MMNIYRKLTVATLGAALSFAAVEATPTEAAIVSRNFTVSDFIDVGIPKEGPFTPGNSYTGSFSYDDSLLTETGAESIGISQLSFNFLGKTYTESDDINYPDYPKVRFLDGKFLGLNYAVTNPGNVAFAFLRNSSKEYMIISELPLPFNAGANRNFVDFPSVTGWRTRGLVTYDPAISTSIPEPNAVVGLVILGLGGWLLKKKASAPMA